MNHWVRLSAPLFSMALLYGCRENAESFFAGRPSSMAMAHNRVLDGSVESMVRLLRIPDRFPDASASHQFAWQDSVFAWWQSGSGRAFMLSAIPESN